MDTGRRVRVELRELRMQCRPTDARCAVIDGFTQLRRRCRQRRDAPPESTEIQHGAADEERDTSTALNLIDEPNGVLHETAGRIALGGVTDVDQMMRRVGPQL